MSMRTDWWEVGERREEEIMGEEDKSLQAFQDLIRLNADKSELET